MYYGFHDEDYREGKRDYEYNGREDSFERDRHFGGERDEAYFQGFDEAKRDEERRQEERREEEREQERCYHDEQERRRSIEMQEAEENDRQAQEDYNRQQEAEHLQQEEEFNPTA